MELEAGTERSGIEFAARLGGVEALVWGFRFSWAYIVVE
jgi:hypothetical protein